MYGLKIINARLPKRLKLMDLLMLPTNLDFSVSFSVPSFNFVQVSDSD